jgi:hypothetical protein
MARRTTIALNHMCFVCRIGCQPTRQRALELGKASLIGWLELGNWLELGKASLIGWPRLPATAGRLLHYDEKSPKDRRLDVFFRQQ